MEWRHCSFPEEKEVQIGDKRAHRFKQSLSWEFKFFQNLSGEQEMGAGGKPEARLESDGGVHDNQLLRIERRLTG